MRYELTKNALELLRTQARRTVARENPQGRDIILEGVRECKYKSKQYKSKQKINICLAIILKDA